MQKTCIIIAGPTAVGKTAIAVEIAKHFSTHIISADSRQCYRELSIGVAKPTIAEQQGIPHYFIDSHSIHDNVNAADFEAYALKSANSIFKEHDIAVMVGGTGLYIRAFCQGMDAMPAIPADLRASIIASFEAKGVGWLQAQLLQMDPVYAAEGEMENPQRMMRALEIVQVTGQPISHFQTGQKKKRDFAIIPICLQLPREDLYERINRRVDMMMEAGLEAEARHLLPWRNLNALQTVGYKELFDYFDGTISLERAVELIKQNSRHYAKRQMTWFNREAGMRTCEPKIEDVMKLLQEVLLD
ncbi:MAG TPA: tRNA (adenosine(37)-N6)-dimethylallyltransferase MiaA [Ferruginibacter sp.]|nr:tRNA (adenosine(37)-N6)-dimethylallyltransferase MiaA [Ferruginibacter sp.]